MYNSPIEILYGQLQSQIEDSIVRAVQDIGINVDREELIKALKYDRDQYNRGYYDAKSEFHRYGQWDKPIEHGLPYKANHLGVVCSYCCSWADNKYNYCPNCGAKMEG